MTCEAYGFGVADRIADVLWAGSINALEIVLASRNLCSDGFRHGGSVILNRRTSAAILLFLLLIFAYTHAVLASPDFSGQTGQACSVCHLNPDGGGALTLRGERFKADGYFWENVDQQLWSRRILKTFLGFLHILFGVVWFGSIVYVHLIIKPQSLIGGMPTSEKRLGRICIAAVGLTGIGLTLLKVQSPRDLWTTSFGIIWMVKVGFYIMMVAVAAAATTVIDRKLHLAAQKTDAIKADGKDGRPAHITYEGRVYDVTDSKLWKAGVHMARHFAGTDLSEAMKKAPHGPEVLSRIKELGPSASRQTDSNGRGVLKIFVGLAYFVLFCILVILLCVAWWNWGPPLIEAFPAWTQKNAAACLDCHNRRTPAMVASWAESGHAANRVSCLHCHQASRSDADVRGDHSADYGGRAGLGAVAIASTVSPKDCSRCHLDRVKEFDRSKHANTVQITRQTDPWLREKRVTPIERVTGCEACHGTGLDESNMANARQEAMLRGIGRLNPDGSKGDCGACHGRHEFSTAQARHPAACGKCHVGPEHPQMEIYLESKHGTIYRTSSRGWNWSSAASTWTAGVDYRTPTCAACHISGAGKTPANHDVSLRLSWELQAPNTVHPAGADWHANRLRMEAVCLQCHSSTWTRSHFARLDRIVEEYNQNYYAPLTRHFEKLYLDSVLDDTYLVDEGLEVELNEFWRREGRQAKMGTAMMAPDYTWWHGFYELKKHYTKITAKIDALKQ